MPFCKNCGQYIEFDTNKNGKRVPVDPDDNALHFKYCGKDKEAVKQRYQQAYKRKVAMDRAFEDRLALED